MSIKGIVISVLGGVVMGLFYPFIAKAIKGENHLGPYTVAFVFALGVLVSNFPVNYVLMRRPVSGPPVSVGDYFRGTGAWHFWGIFGGMVWGVGTISNFVASYAQMVGPRSLLRARPGLDHGRHNLGCVRLEGIQRRRCNHQAAAGADVCPFHHRPCVRGAGAGGEVMD